MNNLDMQQTMITRYPADRRRPATDVIRVDSALTRDQAWAEALRVINAWGANDTRCLVEVVKVYWRGQFLSQEMLNIAWVAKCGCWIYVDDVDAELHCASPAPVPIPES